MKNEHRSSSHSAFKKALSLILCLAMLITAIPFSALASVEMPETVTEETVTEETVEPDENENTEKVIKSIAVEIDGDTFVYEPEDGSMDAEELEDFANSDAGLAMEAKLQPKAKAPARGAEEEKTEFDDFEVSTIVDIVNFRRENNSNVSRAFEDKNGKQHIYYGAKNYSTCVDNNYDLICDTCGYCLDGCADGTLMTYTQEDIDSGKVGDWACTEVEYEYTYDVVKEDGSVETKTETGKYYEYASYYVDGDGFCDKCGKKMHDDLEVATADPHSYADGKCDSCGTCVGGHTDKNNDKLCDFCKKCVADCADIAGADKCTLCGSCIKCVDKTGAFGSDNVAIPDGKCDVCGKCMGHKDLLNNATKILGADGKCDVCDECIKCVDETGAKDPEDETKEIPDGKCDVCGKVICTEHVDADGDKKCDKCGECTCINHTAPDGKCDVCGFCFGKDCIPGADGKCTVCGKTLPSSDCIHSDKLGRDDCATCGKAFCPHMSVAEITQNYQWFAGAYGYLSNEDGTPVDGCGQDWHNNLKAFITAKDEDEAGDVNGIHSVLNMRKEMSSCAAQDETLALFKDSILALTAKDVNANALVGKLTTDAGKTVIDRANSYYEQVNGEGSIFAEYIKTYNECKYPVSKNYFREYKNVAAYKKNCNDHVEKLAGELIDNQLAAVYPEGYNGGNVKIDEKKLAELKVNIKAVEEVLLAHLYGVNYSNGFAADANAVWNGSQNLSSKGEKEKRIIKFLMLDKIREEINKLREAVFTNYQQTTYDDNGKTYYAKREATSDDIARDENKDADDVYVYDETVQNIINTIDGFCTSPEFVDLLGLGKGENIPDRDGDGVITIYDFVMYIFLDKVLTSDMINMLVESVFPTIIKFVEEDLPDMVDGAYYGINVWGNDTYIVDVDELIEGLFKELGLSGTWGNLLSLALAGDSYAALYVNGKGRSYSFEKLFNNAHFSFYPRQVAARLAEANSSGKYNKIINKLNNAGLSWKALLGNDLEGDLGFDWGINSFDDFKEVLSVILSCIDPFIEILFAERININDLIRFKNLGYINGDLNLLWNIFLTLDLTLGLDLELGSFNLYQDVLVPIFEALGVSDFEFGNNYKFTNINYSIVNSRYANAKNAVDKILDPVMTLVEQLAAHPLQKVLSILPNIALFLENGMALDLTDIETSVDAIIDIDFNFDWESILFNCMTKIVNSIMKHWYDWLRPSKYAQWALKTATFLALQPLFKLLFDTVLDKISVQSLLGMASGVMDAADLVVRMVAQLVNGISDLCNAVAGVFGGECDFKQNWSLANPVVDIYNLLKHMNIKDILDMFITEETLGFNVNKLSSIVKFLVENVNKKGTDEQLYKIKTELIDFDELASLGKLEKKTGTIRDQKYYSRFNTLKTGEYYFVSADTSDVFYYLLKTVFGFMGDNDSFNAILSMVGVSYDSVKESVAGIKLGNIDLDKAIINDIVTDGSLDLDKIRKNIDQNDLLVILAELITPENKYSTVDMNWKSSVKMTGETSSYSEIPYLEYDNEWTKEFATTAVNDIDDVANSLIETLGLDLGEAENISQWLKKIFDDMVDGDILSALVKVLAGLGSGMTDDVSALVKKLVGLDLTQWGNDYGYLFTEASAPSSRNFPLLTGKANEDGTYSWVYNGKDVKTYKDVLAALGYVLSPLSKVTDAVLAGKDLKVLEYNKATASTGSVVTVKGTEGYSTAIIPLLESLGVNSDSILTQSQFNNYEGGSTAAFTYSASLLIEKVYSIIESEHPVAELMQLVIQVLYFLSSNGLGVVLNDIAHPIMVLIDIVRPLVSLDLDAIINDLVCEFTYSIGGYTNAEHMKKALELRKASLSIKDLSLEAVMKLAGVILSVSKDGTRKFLDLHTVTAAAIDDLAFLRTEKTSKALDENGNAKKYYEITISGADAFTSIVSFALEAVMFSSNAEIIDAFANSNGIVETAVKTVYGLPVNEDLGFDWAYILSDKASAAEKAELLQKIKSEGSVLCDNYRENDIKYLETYDTNNWTEGTADYLANYLNEMINTVLVDMNSEYKSLGELLSGLVNGYLTDETIDKIVFAIGNALNGEQIAKFKDLIFWADGVLSLDASVYDANNCVKSGDKVVYYKSVLDEEGNVVDLGTPTGLVRRAVTDSESFALALSDIIAPVDRLLSWLLLDDSIEYFNTTGSVKSRRDSLISISGANGYATGLLPLLEALGCKNLKSAASYGNDIRSLVNDMFTSLIARAMDIVSDGDSGAAVNKIIDLLPNLIYFVNSDGLTLAVNNIAAPVNAVFELYSEKSGEEISLSSLSKLPLDDLSFRNIFKLVEEKAGIKINEYITNLFDTFTLGKICYNSASACDFDTYYMDYSDEEDRAEFITIVLSVALDILEDPANKDKFSELFGEKNYEGIINMMNLWKFEFEMQDFSWIFTEYANTGTVLSALTMSVIFKDCGYGFLWTREKALQLVNNLNSFIDDMIYLLGLTINGKKVLNFTDLMHQLIGGYLYSQDVIKLITGALANLKPLLDQYDPQGTLAGFVKELMEVDLHAWDKYTDDYDWGFENGDRKGFENALVEVLTPVSRVIQWLFCDREYSFFVDADSVADENRRGNTDQLAIYGAEGYAFGIVPILEAFNAPNIVKPEDYSKTAYEDKSAALRNLVSPLLDMVDELMDDTPRELFELLPSVIYFINCNGLDTCFRNILHAVYRIFDALEPITGKIDLYEIIGMDLATINFEFLFNKLIDLINDATGFRFTTMLGDAVAELTQGEVISFTSLNGRQAYTMRYAGVNDYADMLTILIRLILRFLSLDGNAKILMDIMQQQFQMSPEDYEIVYSILQTYAKWSASNLNLQVVMVSIYYYVFGSAIASDKGVEAYDKVNGKWKTVVNKLSNLDNPIAKEVMQGLLEIADENTGDVISSDGIAANGLIKFFKMIADWFMKIINAIKSLFNR